MKKSKVNLTYFFNQSFFSWYKKFFNDRPMAEKAAFRKDIYAKAFPFLEERKAFAKFNNLQREKNKTKMNPITAENFFAVAKEYDNTINFKKIISEYEKLIVQNNERKEADAN